MMDQRRIWEEIAESWARLRAKPDDGVEGFLRDRSGLILDVGCGSGRNLAAGKNYVGMDFSPRMITLAEARAKRNGTDALFLIGDAAELPFKGESFDHIMLAAVLHVLESERRARCLGEIRRVLKPGGEVLVTVWSKNQPRFFSGKKETYVPWKAGGKTVMRYYYLFTKGELKSLLEHNGFEVERISGGRKKAFKLFPMNIIAIAKKK